LRPTQGRRTRARLLELTQHEDLAAPTILLVTDGGATCGAGLDCSGPGDCPLLETQDFAVVDAIAQAKDDAVAVVVIGVDALAEDTLLPASYDRPGQGRQQALLAIAEASGFGGIPTEPIFHAENPEGFLLVDPFFGLVDTISSCDLDLSFPPNTIPLPAQVPYVNLYVGSEDTPVDFLAGISPEQCELQDILGWVWLEEGITLRLCGDACDPLKEKPYAYARVIYGCSP
jgi:hypothetical protein